jgi:hypothetical protein
MIVFVAALLISLSTSSVGSAAGERVVFVTSVTGNGDLGSWPDAGMETGTAAGDAICRARALAAGLANSSNFVAWLSDSIDDAYCRLHNLSGKKVTNCGQSTLPVAAGPWLHPNGIPFGEAIDQLLSPNGVVYTALQVDEFGSALPAFAGFFTATQDGGALDTIRTTCGDWASSSSQLAATGSESRTTQNWTNSGGGDCGTTSRLICMETQAGPAVPPFEVPGRIAFVTSVTGAGDLGSWPDAGGKMGIAAGDAICQARATAAGLDEPSSFKAWLSDGTTDAIDRFVNDGRWVRLDGIPVAENKADLTDGVLFAPINVSETGAYQGNWGVWSGTQFTGFGTGTDCAGWTVGTDGTSGTKGTSNDLRFWTHPSSLTCNFSGARLYCLSDSPLPIFADGLESGDTTAWSSTVQ